ncbi:hypothetical protein [Thiorhodococcus fuscus]|uniref:Carbon storage regulator n=1 Tax=Thiorhodococcus fuscus TaxID=527200 RepID=A0ABW4YA69_9GAMM
MSITSHTLTVGENGTVVLRVARPVGTRIRVVVIEEQDTQAGDARPGDSAVALEEAIVLTRLQATSGFARQVLADPAEDVWNDL